MLLHTDLARYSDALPYLAWAQDAARENNDPDLAAHVLACRSFLTSFSGGSPAVAADFAEAAVTASVDGRVSPTTRGCVAAISSRQFAVLGDEREVARVRRLAQAALPTNAAAARRLWAEVVAVTPPSSRSSPSR